MRNRPPIFFAVAGVAATLFSLPAPLSAQEAPPNNQEQEQPSEPPTAPAPSEPQPETPPPARPVPRQLPGTNSPPGPFGAQGPFAAQMMQNAFRLGQLFLGDRGRPNAPVDPTRANIMTLLMREDTRFELGLTTKQREDLDKLRMASQQAAWDRLRAGFQEMFTEMRRGRRNGAGERPTPADREEQIQQFQERAEKIMSSMDTFSLDTEEKAVALLKPAQVRRLYQLDLQWRGPLALSDPKLADALDLSPQQRAEVAKLLQEYREAQVATLQSVWAPNFRPGSGVPGTPPGQNRNPNGSPNAPSGPGGPQPPIGQPFPNAGPPFRGGFPPPMDRETQIRLQEAQKDLEKTAQRLGKKALSLLDSEQQAHLRRLKGRPFTFKMLL